MINCILHFFKSKQKKTVFNKEYRHGYKISWINKIKNYHP